MAYRSNDSGCGCLIALFIVMAIISGVRSCTEHLIDGDIKLPKFGSGHVSGGSGGYGTSNGYNVKYNQTTSPNYNSSLRDYTHTNEQPTEYREGINLQNNNNYSSNSPYNSNKKDTIANTSSYSTNTNNTRTNISQPQKKFYKECVSCKGRGEVIPNVIFHFRGNTCSICGLSDSHSHEEIIECPTCSGRGYIIEYR